MPLLGFFNSALEASAAPERATQQRNVCSDVPVEVCRIYHDERALKLLYEYLLQVRRRALPSFPASITSGTVALANAADCLQERTIMVYEQFAKVARKTFSHGLCAIHAVSVQECLQQTHAVALLLSKVRVHELVVQLRPVHCSALSLRSLSCMQAPYQRSCRHLLERALRTGAPHILSRRLILSFIDHAPRYAQPFCLQLFLARAFWKQQEYVYVRVARYLRATRN